jgi:hypothetical protein
MDFETVEGSVLFHRGTTCPIFEAFPESYNAHQAEVFAIADAVAESALALEGEAVYISPFYGVTFVVYAQVMIPTPDIFFLTSSSLQGTCGYIRFYNFLSEAGMNSFCSKACNSNVYPGK